MTSTQLEADAMPPGCTIFEHRYVGPIPGHNFNSFSICVVFDAGSRRYFSGIRVVVVCKAGVQGYERLDVRLASPRPAIEPSPTSVPHSEDNQSPTEPTERPLSTLVYEIFDSSNDTWDKVDISFRPDARFDNPDFRILCSHIECLDEGGSTSVMLFLSCSKSFHGILKPSSGIVSAYPARTGILALGARILPPPSTRPPFKQPPPEILDFIFRAALEGSLRQAPWRGMLISLGLVCRAWSPALALLYEDFSKGSARRKPPDVIAVARVLEKRPYHGKAIRRLSPFHFNKRKSSPAVPYEQKSSAFVQIVQRALLVTDLTVMDVHAEHLDSLKRALCKCIAVRHFSINQPPPFDGWEEYPGKLSMADLIECVSHWPLLRSLMIFGLSQDCEPLSSESAVIHGDQLTPMHVEKMYLQDGRVMDHELLRLSSFMSLEDVTLSSVSGLTNAGLRKWLESAGQSLRNLALKKTALTRETEDEEWAIDAAIAKMPDLCTLRLDDVIFSELVFMRREKTRDTSGQNIWRNQISVQNVPAGMFNAHLLTVLKYTGWQIIELWGAFSHDRDMNEEAKKIAREQGISLYV